MFRIVAFAAALSFAALPPAFAQTAPLATRVIESQTAVVVQAPEKTSDRTPDNPAPNRTPGASITGAVGTEVARTPFGTSDRTPSNHYTHVSN